VSWSAAIKMVEKILEFSITAINIIILWNNVSFTRIEYLEIQNDIKDIRIGSYIFSLFAVVSSIVPLIFFRSKINIFIAVANLLVLISWHSFLLKH
jgi:hypothetical protein